MLGVALDKVTKSYGGASVIEALSLSVDEGEFVVIVGPSGCGKSTTLRLIAGLEPVTSGQISIRDRDVTHLPPKARDIAMVFQSYALYPHMNVAKNMSFALRLAGVPKSEIQQRVADAAEILELTPFLHRKPKDLSGGQRQRVAMGRAIVRDAYCFLFDEPLSNLDAKLRASMRTELALLHQRLRRTMIYVTHDQIEAMTLADRIVVMNKGTVQQVGAPRELYNHPANRFVAGFIGSPAMNFLMADIVKQGAQLWFRGDGFEFPVPLHLRSRLSDIQGAQLVLGLRPEHFSLQSERLEAPHKISLEVRVSEYIGASQFLTCQVGADAITAVISSAPDSPAMTSGDYYFDLNRLYLFDPVTGCAV